MSTGLNVSKANLYAVLAPSKGVNVSKANLYAVLAPAAAAGQSSNSARNRALFAGKKWQPILLRRFTPPPSAQTVTGNATTAQGQSTQASYLAISGTATTSQGQSSTATYITPVTATATTAQGQSSAAVGASYTAVRRRMVNVVG